MPAPKGNTNASVENPKNAMLQGRVNAADKGRWADAARIVRQRKLQELEQRGEPVPPKWKYGVLEFAIDQLNAAAARILGDEKPDPSAEASAKAD